MRLAIYLAAALSLTAQDFSQRGFVETRGFFYPQTAPNDSGRAIGETLIRYEASKALLPGLRIAGTLDARSDTHRQTERRERFDWQDRSLQRPAFSLRRLSAAYTRGKLTVEAGKQFIRWGKADILNPTDRFAPRDFLAVVDNEFLGVTAARATYETGSNTIDVVWQPRFTPSRTPLLNQRWAVLPSEAAAFSIRDLGSRVPGGSQFGARLNHLGRGYEASLSFYEGHNHLPLIEGALADFSTIAVRRVYPQMTMYGADTAVPLRWFTVKAEAAYFTTRSRNVDEYALYVVQLERQAGELSLVGGYAGEWVTERRSPFDFAPDRGLTRAFLARAGYTLGPTRSVALETAVRPDLDGVWVRSEYSQTIGQHWRATAGFTLIRGEPWDFLGQYRRNSHASLALRYSF